jgi:16S rRNA (uracil1498-N3)-methyltransferase
MREPFRCKFNRPASLTHRPVHPRLLCADLACGLLALDAENSHHLAVVLRARVGDRIVIFDGQGQEGQGVLRTADKTKAVVDIESIQTIRRESPLHITVLQALCTGDKMDWVVQKSTELGAARIIPVAAARSVMKLEPARALKRLEHWRAIAQASAAQSGRTVVPSISPVMSFRETLLDYEQSQDPKTGWLLDPFAVERFSTAPMQGPIAIWIGPEAGWSDEEEQLAKAAGIRGFQIGPRILRTETAAAVALTALAMKCGEF